MQEASKKYDEMWNKVQAGQITEKEWKDFCLEVLEQIIEEDNKEIFGRSKNI